MPGDEVQVSARVSPAERDAIRAHGGLVHLIRKFLADNATEEQAIRLDVGIVGFTNRIEALASRERKKSEAGKLKQADEERIVQKMKLKPDMVIGWLHSPTPEHISHDLLEKARCHNWGSLPSLQSLKEQDNINEPFYALLMKWLNLPTKEDVDTWIVKGFKKASGLKGTANAGELVETSSRRYRTV